MAHPLDPFVPYHTHGPETRPHPAAVDEARNLAEVDPRDPRAARPLRGSRCWTSSAPTPTPTPTRPRAGNNYYINTI